jgi:hypothetical protein
MRDRYRSCSDIDADINIINLKNGLYNITIARPLLFGIIAKKDFKKY